MRGRYSSRAAMAEEACGNQETEDETTVRAPITFKGHPGDPSLQT